jgi:hypothetical protein
MKRFFWITLFLVCALPLAARSEKDIKSINDRIPFFSRCMPDFCQIDQRLPKRGEQYCGPTAVANALVWLAMNGQPDLVPLNEDPEQTRFDVIRTLGSEDYMKTAQFAGTDPIDVLVGLDKYIRNRGLEPIIEWQGYREGGKYACGEIPQLAWMTDKFVNDNFNIVLEIGWYNYCEHCQTYKRNGGHYVTLAGIDLRHNQPTMIIHNPSFGGGKTPLPQACKLRQITTGEFLPWSHYHRRSAAGFWILDGITLPSNAKIAIIEGAIKFSVATKKPDKPNIDAHRHILAEF